MRGRFEEAVDVEMAMGMDTAIGMDMAMGLDTELGVRFCSVSESETTVLNIEPGSMFISRNEAVVAVLLRVLASKTPGA